MVLKKFISISLFPILAVLFLPYTAESAEKEGEVTFSVSGTESRVLLIGSKEIVAKLCTGTDPTPPTRLSVEVTFAGAGGTPKKETFEMSSEECVYLNSVMKVSVTGVSTNQSPMTGTLYYPR